MSNQLSQEGNFRGEITEYGLFEPESGAVGVNIRARILEAWDVETQQWVDWREYDIEAEGCIWLIKRDGTVSVKSSDSLMKYSGWNGDIQAITGGSWNPTPCAFTVGKDSYKDETRYRISFINDHDRKPGGTGNVTPERAAELALRYGSQFRALAGNATRNAPQPAKPPLKKPAPAKKTPPTKSIDDANAAFNEAAEEGNDEIPL